MTESQVLPSPVAFHEVALLLDVDGTLLDIAPRPDDVFVPAPLREALMRLQERTGGAVALVSGRPLIDLDRLFAPLQFAVIGGHGAEIRATPNGPVDRSHAQALEESLVAQLLALASGRPGVLVEDKGYSVAIHYRQAPEQRDALVEGARKIVSAHAQEGINILPGKSVVEIKHKGVNKGQALHKLMTLAPFEGRTPIFIGDDTTDESAIAAVPDYDGYGFAVGRDIPGAVMQFASPSEVRRWIQKIAGAEGPINP